MAVATISSKGWVVIPADLRKKYDLHSGKQVVIVDYGNVLAMIPVLDDPVEDAAGMLRGGPSLLDTLLKERVEELAREE